MSHRPYLTTDSAKTVIACPSCGKAGRVYERGDVSRSQKGNPDDQYSCGECPATFNAYVEREAGWSKDPKRVYPSDLARMNPEEVGL